MKKLFGIVIMLFAALFTFASCTKTDEEETQKVNVKWVDLTSDNEVLKEEEVESGSKVESWIPEKEGYVFDKWYATPSMNIEFDFNKEITSDTTIFGNFVIDAFEVDTRSFYILGSSNNESSIMYGSNFTIKDDAKQKLTKSDSTTENVYTITVDLYIGDKFQLAIDDKVSNQRGFGYIVGDVSEYFREEKSYLSNDSRKADIAVTMDGNYTITLTTHPWADLYDTENEYYSEETKENYNYNTIDTIKIVRNGDPLNESSAEPLRIMIKGSYITAWGHNTGAEYTMVYNEENGLYEYSHEFLAGDSFCFYNFVQYEGEDGEMHNTLGPININSSKVDEENSDVEYLDLTQGNIGTLANGTYSFTYDYAKDSIIIEYSDTFNTKYVPNDTWYVAGSGVTEPLKSSQYGNNLTDAQKLEKVEENTYQITMDLAKGDMFQIVGNSSYGYSHSLSDLKDATKDGVEYFYKAEDNMACRVDGNYTFTLYLDSEAPLKDYITWERNGDIIQEFVVDYDVYLKYAPDWEISQTYQTVEGKVQIGTWLEEGTEFCFIYYDKGTPIEEVGSYQNPGLFVGGQMIGTTGEYNDKITGDTGNNNAKSLVSGYYTIQIDFTQGSPKIDVVNYQESLPAYNAVIKGPAYDGTWNNSEEHAATNGIVDFSVTLTGGSDKEFGFTLYSDSFGGQYGEYIGYYNLGTKGDANSVMTQQANYGNNFVCTKSGTYRVVIDRTSGTAVVDFYYA